MRSVEFFHKKVLVGGGTGCKIRPPDRPLALQQTAARMTPLGRFVAARIAAEGPMRLDEYMALRLDHPEHGYWKS